MWEMETATTFEKDAKHYARKHPRELAAVLRNLQRYLSQLNCSKDARSVCKPDTFTMNPPELWPSTRRAAAPTSRKRDFTLSRAKRRNCCTLSPLGINPTSPPTSNTQR